MNRLSVGFILIVATISQFHAHEVPNEINLDRQNKSITKHEVSKVYAQKLINQFSSQNEMKIYEFENMLRAFEEQFTELELNETLHCIDGLRILSLMETESGIEKNLTKSFEIDVDHMVSVCPILLFHISNQSLVTESTCIELKRNAVVKESRALVWFYSTIALVGISLCGLLGVIVIPIVDKNYYFYVLQFFMALAVGTLTGDALLHLLPHAMRPLNDMTQPELLRMMMHRGIAAVLGIMSFCMVERFLTLITKWKSRDKGENSSNSISKPEAENLHKHSHKHGHSHGAVDTQSESLSSIVWMVILGDGLHNFTDGMAIGAAFSNNIAGGFSTAVAVFCHELPHELGDFAVLLKAGMSARKAIYYNILSSILSFIGMCVGISIGDTPETTQWVFAAAAGLFIYIALVDMVNNEKFVQRDF